MKHLTHLPRACFHTHCQRGRPTTEKKSGGQGRAPTRGKKSGGKRRVDSSEDEEEEEEEEEESYDMDSTSVRRPSKPHPHVSSLLLSVTHPPSTLPSVAGLCRRRRGGRG